MPDLTIHAFRLAGLILLGLVAANFVAAKRWDYRRSLAETRTIVRQVFYVHCAYIIVIITALALLCLAWPELLLSGPMGRVLCGFFAIFWGSRVLVQLLYYDRELRKNDRLWDVFFLIIFLTLATIFGLGVMA